MEPLPPDRPRRGAPEFEALRTALREMADRARAGPRAGDRGRAAPRLPGDRAAGGARDAKPAHADPPRRGAARAARRAPRSARPSRCWSPSRTGSSSWRASSPSSAACPRARPRRSTSPSCWHGARAHQRAAHDAASASRSTPTCPPLLGHYDPLRRAFSNILRNAVEACDGQGEIELSAAPEDGGVRIEIRDHGPGVPPELAGRHLRSLRHREERRHRPRPGAGQADGRDAPGHASRVEPTPGGGATFVVRMRGR